MSSALPVGGLPSNNEIHHLSKHPRNCLSVLLFALVVCLAHASASFGQVESRPHVVIVAGTWHYAPHLSLPLFSEELRRHGFRTTLITSDTDPEKKRENVLPGLEALRSADLAIFFMRFLQLPDEEWGHIEHYITSGKPVIGLRTTNHSFRYPENHPRHPWNDDFGRRVLGTPYIVHQASPTELSIVEKYQTHPLLDNIEDSQWLSPAKLYLTRLEPGCVPLMVGTGSGRARLLEKPFGVIQVNETEADIVAWTWTNEWDSRVFSTTLGHPGDFGEERFVRLLINGVCWATDRPMLGRDDSITTWDVPMHR